MIMTMNKLINHAEEIKKSIWESILKKYKSHIDFSDELDYKYYEKARKEFLSNDMVKEMNRIISKTLSKQAHRIIFHTGDYHE